MSTKRDAAHHEALQRIQTAHENGANELSLADLALEHLPKELGELTALTTLRLAGCLQLNGIPVIAHCTRLTVVDLCDCPQVVDLNPTAKPAGFA